MTEIEEFLASRQMIHCAKMSADITQEKCRELKESGRYSFHCDACNGGEEMGTKGKACSVEGCNTQSWKGGFCWKHEPGNVAARTKAAKEKPVNAATEGKERPAPAPPATPPHVTEKAPPAVNPLSSLIPCVSPDTGAKMIINLPSRVAGLCIEHNITPEVVADLIIWTLNGEMERHPYRSTGLVEVHDGSL
jgi:hypothetical protein